MFLTVGHSTHGAPFLADFLCERGVTDLIDVRSKPYSRFNYGFNKERFYRTLADRGIQYDWRGETLGGFAPRNDEMATTLDRLVSYFARRPGRVPVLMCSEGAPCECHRHHWLTPYILQNSRVAVTHIHPKKPDEDASQVPVDPTFNADENPWPIKRDWWVHGEGVPAWIAFRAYATKKEAQDAVRKSCPHLRDAVIISTER